MVMEAAIKDILDKLKRGAELLESEAIAITVLKSFPRSFSGRMRLTNAAASAAQATTAVDAPSMPHSNSIGLSQLVPSGPI